MKQFIPIWKQALNTDFLLHAKKMQTYTSRFTVSSPIAGSNIRLRLKNFRSPLPYEIEGIVIKTAEGCYRLTVEGQKTFRLAPQSSRYSDELPLEIREQQRLDIRICFTGKVNDANRIEPEAVLVRGNCLYQESFQSKQSSLAKKMNLYAPIPIMDAVEVLSESDPAVIVAFGDSITALSQWTKPLERRLREKYPGKVVLLNAGISGNCLLYERPDWIGPFFGRKGIDRFAEDVLETPNLRTVIFGLGVNDVSYYNAKTKSQINQDSYAREVTCIAERLKEKGVRMIMQTLTPRVGVSAVMGIYKPDMEDQRLIFNNWIRSTDYADGLFDAEHIVGVQTKKGLQFKEGWHVGDHLHPNAIGGEKLAEAYDLELLLGEKP